MLVIAQKSIDGFPCIEEPGVLFVLDFHHVENDRGRYAENEAEDDDNLRQSFQKSLSRHFLFLNFRRYHARAQVNV